LRLTAVNCIGGTIDTRLVVRPYEDVPRERIYHALPNVLGDSEFGVYNNTLRAACIALTERYLNLKVDGVLTKPIQPERNIYVGKEIIEFRDYMVRKNRHIAHVYSRSDVVDMYTGQKQRLYRQAMESLSHDPLTTTDARLKTFIKFEKCNVGKAPRIINPRSTRYTLELARYLKKLEKPIYSSINDIFKSCSRHTVIKGLNVFESASVIKEKWDRFVDPVAIGGDITKLDMHVGVAALNFEHSIYDGMFNSRKLRRLLKMQLTNRGRAYFQDGHVSFSMRGTRCSGDINTSLGNVLIVCAVIYAFKRHYNLDFELINNGDDFVIIAESSLYEEISTSIVTWFKSFGFILKAEPPVYEFEQLEFCQTKPVFDGLDWRMCRIPATVFKKDTLCTMPIPNRATYRMWLAAVGDGGCALTYGLPVLSAFYAMYRRSGSNYTEAFYQRVYKNTSMFEKRHKVVERDSAISQEARYSFYVAFGILPDIQRAMESYFNSIDITDEVVDAEGYVRDLAIDVPIFGEPEEER